MYEFQVRRKSLIVNVLFDKKAKAERDERSAFAFFQKRGPLSIKRQKAIFSVFSRPNHQKSIAI
jgi:hypothetical protein